MLTFTLQAIYQIVRGHISPPKLSLTKTVDVAFRCWPIDMDAFLHMNNSRYLLNAELARWRTVSACSDAFFTRVSSKEGILFLAVENKIQYLRPIAPFERYVISTTCTTDDSSSSSSSTKNDKWLYFRHVFQQHPDDIIRRDDNDEEKDAVPLTYAVIDLKAVVKQKNGVTIKPSTLMNESKFYREWVTTASKRDTYD